jgi:hypothetical protein
MTPPLTASSFTPLLLTHTLARMRKIKGQQRNGLTTSDLHRFKSPQSCYASEQKNIVAHQSEG